MSNFNLDGLKPEDFKIELSTRPRPFANIDPERLEPCESCGTPILLYQFFSDDEPAWLERLSSPASPGSWWIKHTRDRCRAARDFTPLAARQGSGTTRGGDTGEPRAGLNPHTPG